MAAWRLDGPADAPVVVLGPSLGTAIDLWEPQVPSLVSRFRVLRFELPGHGGSNVKAPSPCRIADLADDVIGIIDELDLARFAFAGISIGGMIGMHLASTVPERVTSLVVCCSSPHVEGPAWAERIRLVRDEGMEAVADLVLPRLFTPAFAAGHPDVVASVRSMVVAVDPDGYASCCEAIGAMDLRDQLANIRAPTLVIAGADDPATPGGALEIVSRTPGARLAVIPEASHLANLEQPEAVTAALVAHLRGDAGAYAAGLDARRAVLGADYVDAAVASTSSFRAPFDDFVTRSAWGMVWTRDEQLDWRTRSCITVAMLTALGRFDELALHVRAARRNGVTVEEIREVLLQTAVYCGAPTARSAFAVAEQALADEL